MKNPSWNGTTIRNVTPSLSTLRQRPHWSFSSISGLINYCSLKWAFQRVYKEEPLFTPVPLIFGKTYHSALTFAFGKMSRGESCSNKESMEVFADLLVRDFKACEPKVKLGEGETIDSLIEQGRRMIDTYLNAVDITEEVIGVATPFSVPLQSSDGISLMAPLIGEYDLVVKKNGFTTIVDWKTSARKWPGGKARTDLQPTCYLHAYRHNTGQTAAFRFDVVTKAKSPVCDYHPTTRGRDDFDRLVKLVSSLDRLVQAEAFIPQDCSWECKSCPYGMACQSWHRQRAATQVEFNLAA